MTTPLDRYRFTLTLARQLGPDHWSWNRGAPWVSPEAEAFATKLLRWGTTYMRLQEAACNRGLTPAEECTSARVEELCIETCGAWGQVYRLTDTVTGSIVGLWHGESPDKPVTSTVKGEHTSIVTPIFSSDPRGATIKLKLATGYADDWGQEGLCVPTS